jgi:hypothetical protein
MLLVQTGYSYEIVNSIECWSVVVCKSIPLILALIVASVPTLFSRRQDLMIKYEAIREQMKEAQTEREKETMVALAAEAEKETFMTGEEKPKDVSGSGRTPGRGLLLGRRKELPEITQRIARVRDSNIAGANTVVEEGLRSLGLSSRVLAPEMAAGDPEKTE